MSSRARCNRSTRSWRGPWASDIGGRPARPVVRGLLVAAALFLGGEGARAEKRVALVIGNSSYQNLPSLTNPRNDASDIATALKQRGFEVVRGADLDLAGLKAAVARFGAAASGADVSLVYYAGHGFQLAQQNYLVPVDAKIASQDDIAGKTLRLGTVIEALEKAPGIKLLVLDACRNNPLGKDGGGPGAQDGLARVGNAAGFLISYATQPDNVAFDGGGRNSPFAAALLSHVATQGQDVASMMIAVRRDVLTATGGFQVPWENSSLTRQFYFAPGTALVASPETQLWQLAASVKDPSLLRVYLERFPEGAHAGEVKSLMKTKLASLGPDPGSLRSAPEDPTAADERLWALVQRSRMRPLVEYYIARHPTGRHKADADELLSSLPDLDDATAPPAQLCERMATHPRDATANAAGVPLAELARNADVAIGTCQRATFAHPEMPHYVALLARSMAAAGRRDEAVTLYRDAAERGDVRAMVSLGLILETGDGAGKNTGKAVELYERAVSKGSADGAINLAVMLMEGGVVPKNPARAVKLLSDAAASGSAIATYNLGVLAQSQAGSVPGDALTYFKRAIELGDSRGYVPAAILLDEGRGVRKEPEEAGRMLLRSVASDSGEAMAELTSPKSKTWSRETIKAVQTELRRAGLYNGPLDGRGGKALTDPLRQWRRFGNLEALAKS